MNDIVYDILKIVEDEGYKVIIQDNCSLADCERAEIRFLVDGYEDWLFGLWITPLSCGNSFVSVFGMKKEDIHIFTPKHATFSFSEIYDDENSSVIWHADSFINQLQMIKNSGKFGKWIFNKKAHEENIIKYLLKSLFTWKKKQK